MAMIQFVQNYSDLSTDKGYQFKFHCDKCGNGYMTRFQASTLGMAESALRVAGSLFGGFFDRVGNSAYEVQRAVGGKAHDDALEAAVGEGKQHFHQCARCGRWVCPEVCWNAQAQQCGDCSPNFEKEFAAAHADAKVSAARSQLYEKAQQVNYVGNVDMAANAYAPAPGPATAAADRCTSCGTTMGNAKFCPQCGTPRPAGACPGCHTPIQANTKFCGNCGTKIV